MIRVLILAGSPVTHAGLESLLRARPGLEPVSAANAGQDGASISELVQEARADVVLLVEGEGGDGLMLDLPSAQSGEPFGAPLVWLAAEPEARWSIQAIRLGLRAVLPRDASIGEIVAAVEAAAAGLVTQRAESAESALAQQAAWAPNAQPDRRLSPRETDVLRLLAQGLGNKGIAAQLGISEHTVKFHIASIFVKLGAASRTEAVTIGIRSGVIPL